MLFGHNVVTEARCIGIFAILINTLYLKKAWVGQIVNQVNSFGEKYLFISNLRESFVNL
jgi:hypothetical protein